jgi:hypothetical protein
MPLLQKLIIQKFLDPARKMKASQFEELPPPPGAVVFVRSMGAFRLDADAVSDNPEAMDADGAGPCGWVGQRQSVRREDVLHVLAGGLRPRRDPNSNRSIPVSGVSAADVLIRRCPPGPSRLTRTAGAPDGRVLGR